MFKKIKKIICILKNNAEIDDKSTIGYQTYIGKYSQIVDSSIGKYCSIASGCKIGLYNHCLDNVTTHPFINLASYGFLEKDYFTQSKTYNKRNDLTIGSDVYIGVNAIILRGVTIGHGAVVGAGAVVTKDIPPYAIVVGNPARIIRYRFDEKQIEKLLKIKWWEWEKDKIINNMIHFYNMDEFLNIFDPDK